MNSVKVVGGLVEIGAAFKFLNTAELAFGHPRERLVRCPGGAHGLDRPVGRVRDLPARASSAPTTTTTRSRSGPGRMIFGCCFLGLALYMAPALFGRPPQSLVWDRLIVGILPPDAVELGRPTRVAGQWPDGAAVDAACQPRSRPRRPIPSKAERRRRRFHGVVWGMSFDQARELAAAQKKPILIDFTGVNCANCRLMERRVLPKPEVVALLRKFVTVQLYTDYVPIASLTADHRKALAEKNQERSSTSLRRRPIPSMWCSRPTGRSSRRWGATTSRRCFRIS